MFIYVVRSVLKVVESMDMGRKLFVLLKSLVLRRGSTLHFCTEQFGRR